ncbi:protein translocase subunit SecD [Planctomycetota bacterium]
MKKNLNWKIVLIIIFALVAVWTIYPPNKTLKPGLDLAGGTSLVYQIDDYGLKERDKKGLSQNMITVLRRRIDPANIQNLVWRPQGNTRFEIQMPLASAKARQKRQEYEQALSDLLEANINPALIMRSLSKPADQRTADFERIAADNTERLEILTGLAAAHDARADLQQQRDDLFARLTEAEKKIADGKFDIVLIKQKLSEWKKLDDKQLEEAIKESVGSGSNKLLVKYVKAHSQWSDVVEQLTEPETGKNEIYKNAKRKLIKLNLTEEQLTAVLEMPQKSKQRAVEIDNLKTQFENRANLIATVVDAFDQYRPFQGRLDDPKDLQRMLKGAGILEFRILPTLDHPDTDTDEMAGYVETLQEKGPKYASSGKYVWCEIEEDVDIAVWQQSIRAVVAQFGNKFYVLASNQGGEGMLHNKQGREWKLKSATPGTEYQTGQRAINFTLNEKGGAMFRKVSGKNIGRPLCILLDNIAVSAPNLKSEIGTRGQITGSFSDLEVQDMVNKLNAGSLPARLIEQPIYVKTIGPSIGADNRDLGIKAGLIGFVVVAGCMLAYYGVAGALAVIALVLNLLFVLAIMALVKATFTLPGIAGLILTIGMSVDANVLIFERIREEQKKGSSLAIAIRNGYQRAFRTIFDANLTTFITAAILFWVASEEIKGFAIVLMLGLASSMFTALFVTRVIFDFLLSKRIIKDHLFMFQLVKKPNINWMKLRPVFMTISVLLIVAGLAVFFTRDEEANSKYDIEFTGGTSVTIDLKPGVQFTRADIEEKIHQVGIEWGNPALAAANVYSVGTSGSQYEINTTETNKTSTTVSFKDSGNTVETITEAIGVRLNNLVVAPATGANSFVVATSMTNKSLVKDTLQTAFPDAQVAEPQVAELVNDAVIKALGDYLKIQLNLQPTIIATEKITEKLIDAYPELTDFLGGIRVDCRLQRQTTAADIDQRFRDLRSKPAMRGISWYNYQILNSDLTSTQPNQQLKAFTYLSVEPEAGFRELSEDEWSIFVEGESEKVFVATSFESSLSRVTQIDPSIGGEAKTQALIAIVLSLFAIVTYIWIRFGDIRYGLAAIVALVHDVCITLGAVTACTYLASTPIGEKLLIGDFKIGLTIVAAFLTIIGYSLNDTIVIFDRIRENRKKAQLIPQAITNSINQTISRTILTSFTTFIVVLIMYIFGGEALRGFTFSIGLGVIIGTYSSIAIAAPILLIAKKK